MYVCLNVCKCIKVYACLCVHVRVWVSLPEAAQREEVCESRRGHANPTA